LCRYAPDVYSFAFNPVNPNLVAGGLLNGQVCLWWGCRS
jgi:hypothetical protein